MTERRRRKGDTTVENVGRPLSEVFIEDDVRTLCDAVQRFDGLDLEGIKRLAVETGGIGGVRLSRLAALAEQMVSVAHSEAEAAAMMVRLDVIVGGGNEVEVRTHYGLPDNVRVLCPRP